MIARGIAAGDDPGELCGGLYGTGPHDGPGDPLGVAFLPVFPQDLGDLPLGPAVDDLVGGEGLGRVHPHVQGAFHRETEAPLRVIELERGHPQIEEDAIHLIDPLFAEYLLEMAEVALDQAASFPETGEPLAGHLEGIGVPIDPDELRSPFEDRLGMAPGPHRGIDDKLSRPGFQKAEDLFHHHRLVQPGDFIPFRHDPLILSQRGGLGAQRRSDETGPRRGFHERASPIAPTEMGTRPPSPAG